MADTKSKRKRKGERPDGLIQVSLQIGYKPDGRPDRKYFYGHSRAEAERKRDEYRASALVGAKFSKDITVSEWVSIFKQTYIPFCPYEPVAQLVFIPRWFSSGC